jgi:hypothetical protein
MSKTENDKQKNPTTPPPVQDENGGTSDAREEAERLIPSSHGVTSDPTIKNT